MFLFFGGTHKDFNSNNNKETDENVVISETKIFFGAKDENIKTPISIVASGT